MIREPKGKHHVWSCTVIIRHTNASVLHFSWIMLCHCCLKCLVACQWSSSELQYLLPCLIKDKCKFVLYWFCGLASLDELEHWMFYHPWVNCPPLLYFFFIGPMKDCFCLYTLKLFKPVWKKAFCCTNLEQKRVDMCDILLISDKEAE